MLSMIRSQTQCLVTLCISPLISFKVSWSPCVLISFKAPLNSVRSVQIVRSVSLIINSYSWWKDVMGFLWHMLNRLSNGTDGRPPWNFVRSVQMVRSVRSVNLIINSCSWWNDVMGFLWYMINRLQGSFVKIVLFEMSVKVIVIWLKMPLDKFNNDEMKFVYLFFG